MSVEAGADDLEAVRVRLAREPGDLTPHRVARALRETGRPVGDAAVLGVYEALRRDVVGAGPLEPLLRTSGVTDVLVNGADRVYLDRGAGLELTGVRFPDDEAVRRLAQRLAAEGLTVETYGESEDATLRLEELRSTASSVRYYARLDGESLGEVMLPQPGRHLGLNSAAAVLTTLRLGLPRARILDALAAFPGVRRRFELKGVADGVRVYDEYAYHPTAMTAALSTLQEVAGDARLVVVFQPYRVYRTRDLRTEIAAALANADEVIVMEVFGPGEARGPGDGGIALTAAVPLPNERKAFVASWEDVPAAVLDRARPGDLVVTMGAPPISLMGDELLAALAARERDAAAADA